jgi:hypothetical protein
LLTRIAFTVKVAPPASVSVIELESEVKIICGFVWSIPATSKVKVVSALFADPSFT